MHVYSCVHANMHSYNLHLTTLFMQSKGVPQFYGLYVAMGRTLYGALIKLDDYYLLCRDCINNRRNYEWNLSRLSFWTQLSVWWVRQLPNHLLQGHSPPLHAQTQHSCSSLEGYSLLKCYNLDILTSMHMHFLHSSVLLLSSS